MTTTQIDYAHWRAVAPLRSIIEADCGPASHGRYRHAAHGDRDAALQFYPDTNEFHCFSCGAGGDVFDYLLGARGMGPEEVVAYLDPAGTGESRPKVAPTPRPAVVQAEPYRDPDWQAAVAEFVADCRATLFHPDGAEALGYLHGRGLNDRTLRAFGVGFNPRWRSLGEFGVLPADDRGRRELIAHRGIVLPLIARNSWFDDLDPTPGPQWRGAVIRRQDGKPGDPLLLMANGKQASRYLALRGTRRNECYPFPDLEPGLPPGPAFICEGELDALTTVQQAGHLAWVATTGGATGTPSDHAIAQLNTRTHLFIATDRDHRGAEAYLRWQSSVAVPTTRARLPVGFKDANAYHAAGHDLAAWITTNMARYGIAVQRGEAYEGDLDPSLPTLV